MCAHTRQQWRAFRRKQKQQEGGRRAKAFFFLKKIRVNRWFRLCSSAWTGVNIWRYFPHSTHYKCGDVLLCLHSPQKWDKCIQDCTNPFCFFARIKILHSHTLWGKLVHWLCWSGITDTSVCCVTEQPKCVLHLELAMNNIGYGKACVWPVLDFNNL